jgi:nitroreductase
MDMTVDDRLGFILDRRSVRVYAPGEINQATVRKLLEAAMAAPSAAAGEPWRFVVVRNRQTLARIAIVLPHGQMLAEAALGIVVCGDLDVAHDRQISYLLQDCSAAIENLLLGAHALGLGACWLGIHPREQRIKSIRDILALPAAVIPVACVSIGFPIEAKEPRASYRPEYVHMEQW